ncbi:MAG: hypothetical protein ACU837_07235 [Gammaproteobacteria bacterium]
MTAFIVGLAKALGCFEVLPFRTAGGEELHETLDQVAPSTPCH